MKESGHVFVITDMFADGDKGDRNEEKGDGSKLGRLEAVGSKRGESTGGILDKEFGTGIIPVLRKEEEAWKVEEGLDGDIGNTCSIGIDGGEEVDERAEVNDVAVVGFASIVSDQSEQYGSDITGTHADDKRDEG